jgi:hypothetical protein
MAVQIVMQGVSGPRRAAYGPEQRTRSDVLSTNEGKRRRSVTYLLALDPSEVAYWFVCRSKLI